MCYVVNRFWLAEHVTELLRVAYSLIALAAGVCAAFSRLGGRSLGRDEIGPLAIEAIKDSSNAATMRCERRRSSASHGTPTAAPGGPSFSSWFTRR